MSLNVEGYIEEGIASKIQEEEGKNDELGNNSAEMTKKNEGKKPSTPEKLKRTKGSEGKRKFSTIWDHFTRNNYEKNSRASCNYCSQSYASDYRNSGTSNLWSYLQFKCRKSPYTMVDKKQKIVSFDAKKEVRDGDSAKIGNLKVVKYDPKAIRQASASMIIRNKFPFIVIEGEGFQDYSHLLEPRFVIPSRITVWRDCMKLFMEHKKLLKNERLCLTNDTWSSIRNYNYMCLTAHCIDQDWKLQKRILNFCQVPNHKGSTIGRVIESCLLDWGIEHVYRIFACYLKFVFLKKCCLCKEHCKKLLFGGGGGGGGG